MHENPRDGDLLMDSPETTIWEELKKKERDEKEWTQTVCRIKNSFDLKKGYLIRSSFKNGGSKHTMTNRCADGANARELPLPPPVTHIYHEDIEEQ